MKYFTFVIVIMYRVYQKKCPIYLWYIILTGLWPREYSNRYHMSPDKVWWHNFACQHMQNCFVFWGWSKSFSSTWTTGQWSCWEIGENYSWSSQQSHPISTHRRKSFSSQEYFWCEGFQLWHIHCWQYWQKTLNMWSLDMCRCSQFVPW